jgi:hypothetical protein
LLIESKILNCQTTYLGVGFDMAGQTLSASSVKVGCLYPILIDNNGEIIDGEHRFQANRNWRKVKLTHIKTEQDRLIVRIVANNVRRSVPAAEKNELLNQLGEIMLKEGVEPGQIAAAISEKTGMSYRWVAKYLASEFKDKIQSTRARLAARHAAEVYSEVASAPKRKGSLLVKNYINSSFVIITVPREFYADFEKRSLSLGIPVENSIQKALEQHLEKMEQMQQLKAPLLIT